jgi:ketosteroid isomerase-like protein
MPARPAAAPQDGGTSVILAPMAGAGVHSEQPPAAGVGDDLVARTRASMEATNRRDHAEATKVFADDAVFDVSSVGLGSFRGRSAIRTYLEEWVGAYERQRFERWDGEELGGGVVFVVAQLNARPTGSSADVREWWAFTVCWERGEIVRVVTDRDIEQARKAAERRAAE